MAARDTPTAMTEMPTLRTSVLTIEQGLTDTAAMTDTTGMILRLWQIQQVGYTNYNRYNR